MEIYSMITKKFSVRKIKVDLPLEKKTIFLYSSAQFYYFQSLFHRALKKKLSKMVANIVGFQIILL